MPEILCKIASLLDFKLKVRLTFKRSNSLPNNNLNLASIPFNFLVSSKPAQKSEQRPHTLVLRKVSICQCCQDCVKNHPLQPRRKVLSAILIISSIDWWTYCRQAGKRPCIVAAKASFTRPENFMTSREKQAQNLFSYAFHTLSAMFVRWHARQRPIGLHCPSRIRIVAGPILQMRSQLSSGILVVAYWWFLA